MSKRNIFVFGVLVLFYFNLVYAATDNSINYSEMVLSAKANVDVIISKNLSFERISESYEECREYYLDQKELEELGRRTDYSKVIKFCNETSVIFANELEATDELAVFIDEYNSMNASFNLSSMDDTYNEIVSSYSSERFEDTLRLIPDGYSSLTLIQSSQTALNLFYSSTSLSIKNFFINNWKSLLITFFVIFSLWIVFRKQIKVWRLSSKIDSLEARKGIIKILMENLQKDYFSTKKISENEYNVKMKSFSEMTLDISRQTLLCQEELSKIHLEKIENQDKVKSFKKRLK